MADTRTLALQQSIADLEYVRAYPGNIDVLIAKRKADLAQLEEKIREEQQPHPHAEEFRSCKVHGAHIRLMRHTYYQCTQVNPGIPRDETTLCNVCGLTIIKSPTSGEWIHADNGMTTGYARRPHHALPTE